MHLEGLSIIVDEDPCASMVLPAMLLLSASKVSLIASEFDHIQVLMKDTSKSIQGNPFALSLLVSEE
jgi:hypothetical protein